jgi:hypothetical protein
MHTSEFGEGGPVYFGSDDARRGIAVALRVVCQQRPGQTFSPAQPGGAQQDEMAITSSFGYAYRGVRQLDATV